MDSKKYSDFHIHLFPTRCAISHLNFIDINLVMKHFFGDIVEIEIVIKVVLRDIANAIDLRHTLSYT